MSRQPPFNRESVRAAWGRRWMAVPLLVWGLFLSLSSVHAQSANPLADPVGRTDYRNEVFTDTPTNAPLTQAASLAFYSGNVGAGANVTTPSLSTPNDGQVCLVQSIIGQPVGIAVVPFTLSVQGSGVITPSPAPDWFQLGQVVSLTATPGRYYVFDHWTDNVYTNTRTVVVGVTNSYAAIFTNTVALETNTFAGGTCIAPVGTPVVLINSNYYPDDVVVTNDGAIVQVTLLTTYTNGIIRYTLDGGDPIAGNTYTGTFNVPAPFCIQAAGFTSLNDFPKLADPVSSLSVTVPGGGGVTVTSQTDLYDGSASAVLTATNAAGWTFMNWTNDSRATNPVITLAMDQPKSVMAVFGTAVAPTANDANRGYVTNIPPQALYAYDSVVRLGAVPTTANKFGSWGGCLSGSNNPVEFAVTVPNPGISANFASNNIGEFALTVLTIDEGDVVKSPSANSYASGANVTLTATSRVAHSFVCWTNDASGTNNPITVTMTNSKVIYATFAVTQPRFVLSTAAYSVNESNGTVAVTVFNQGAFGTNVTVATSDGTALGGNATTGDYTPTNVVLSFGNGPSSQTIQIPIRDQFLQAADKSFQVSLSNPGTGGSLGSPSNATVTIHYNDAVNTNGSLLVQAAPEPVPDRSGSLRVTIDDPPAVSGGFWRFPWELGWRSSGVLVTNLTPGNDPYPIEFRQIQGYSIPLVNLEDGLVHTNSTTDITRQYTQVSAAETGQLVINLGPVTTNVTMNGGWRLVGETNWQATGATLSNLPPATNYLVEFRIIEGLVAPGTMEVPVYVDQKNVIPAYYRMPSTLSNAALPNPLPSLADITGSVTNTPRLPFAFNGQLRSDVGFGSGVAVRERSVLTAAHLLYDDVNLSFVNMDTLYWFFQKEAGELDPQPLKPRGYYLLSGYSAARTNDLTMRTNLYSPGVSSPDSRSSDVAVLYFQKPAARRGFGGYLASDAATNEWLMSPMPKMLAGYPLDGTLFGCTNIVANRMHATATNNYVFIQETNRVYLTTGFLSFPGNSGGPVYVLHPTNGIYYPAAVFLGVVGNSSAVRAIDNDVVNLITLAESAASTGDGGTNFTGGGVIRIVSSTTSGSVGYVQVFLGPAGAVSAGGGWRVFGTTNAFVNNTNFTASFTSQTAQIEFREVDGWESPPGRSVTIPRGLTVIEASYLAKLQINLSPAAAVVAGGGWRFAGDTNDFIHLTNGTRIITSNVNATIQFSTAYGWISPPSKLLSLTAGQPQVYSAGYTVVSPALSLSPTEFRITGTTNTTYRIEYRTNLTSGAWAALWTNTLDAGVNLLTPWPPTNNLPAAFYRAVWLP